MTDYTKENCDTYWKQFDTSTVTERSNVESKSVSVTNTCVHCGGQNIEDMDKFQIICHDCGASNTYATNDAELNMTFKNDIPIVHRKKVTKAMSKVEKRILWSQYTNEEKNEYKLKEYTTELCNTLAIPELLMHQIKYTVTEVMKIIRSTDGTKRARVKDGIILVCIEYIAKRNDSALTAAKLSKIVGLDAKYITRAETLVLELLHNKKLNLDKDTILSTRTPYHYVQDIVFKRSLRIDKHVLESVRRVIDICESNDLLLDHTPLSIGVCCFYYVVTELAETKDTVDIRVFSELYDLSVVTIAKTTNKLKGYDDFIKRCL